MGFKRLKVFQIYLLGIIAEVTVAQKLNQGTIPKKGCNLFREPFFVSFLGEQKRKT